MKCDHPNCNKLALWEDSANDHWCEEHRHSMVARIKEYECTKESPMPKQLTTFIEGLNVIWRHMDAVETDGDFERRVQYYCPNCERTFWVDLGD